MPQRLRITTLICALGLALQGCLISFEEFPEGNLCAPPDDPAEYDDYLAWKNGDPNAPDDIARRRSCPRNIEDPAAEENPGSRRGSDPYPSLSERAVVKQQLRFRRRVP
jgi:hypothetical protein